MSLEGQFAPDFTLPRDHGGSVTLSGLRPAAVVVYFYPRDDTPGCTREAQDFTALAPDFAVAGATVIGISRDDVASHDRFCAKYGLGVILASDADGEVCERYGVWVEKQQYGRKFMGIERATFLVGGDGRVVREWRKVKVEGHAAAVLDAVRGL